MACRIIVYAPGSDAPTGDMWQKIEIRGSDTGVTCKVDGAPVHAIELDGATVAGDFVIYLPADGDVALRTFSLSGDQNSERFPYERLPDGPPGPAMRRGPFPPPRRR